MPPAATDAARAERAARWAEHARQASSAVATAAEAVRHNTLRAALTSLGILFGVASVIAMLAIGKGAEQEILEQMKLLGTNNVVVTPVDEQKEGKAKDDDAKEPRRFSPGLTALDAASIAEVIPSVDATSGEVVVQTMLTREGRRRTGRVVGVDTTYFRLLNMGLAEGAAFSAEQVRRGAPVAVVGHGVVTRFFTTEPPIGGRIKVGNEWLTVIGVLADRKVSAQAAEHLGIRDPEMDVYVPLPTMLLRYRNRAEVSARDVQAASSADGNGGDDAAAAASTDDEARQERRNGNQLDRIVVRVNEASMVPQVADVIRRMLVRRHNQRVDFEVAVPELLLKQEQRTKTIFNVVLGAIASISLVVGGIGIMNIMLASVLERIREIGVRRAVGASQRDILAQFLSEAVMISLAGGVAGILVGAALSAGIERGAGIRTSVSFLSVAVAFGVSLSVGLVFGIVPAWRAARQDPVVCLRYE